MLPMDFGGLWTAARATRPGDGACSSGSGWPTRPRKLPSSTPVASSSASPSPGRWPTTRRCRRRRADGQPRLEHRRCRASSFRGLRRAGPDHRHGHPRQRPRQAGLGASCTWPTADPRRDARSAGPRADRSTSRCRCRRHPARRRMAWRQRRARIQVRSVRWRKVFRDPRPHRCGRSLVVLSIAVGIFAVGTHRRRRRDAPAPTSPMVYAASANRRRRSSSPRPSTKSSSRPSAGRAASPKPRGVAALTVRLRADDGGLRRDAADRHPRLRGPAPRPHRPRGGGWPPGAAGEVAIERSSLQLRPLVDRRATGHPDRRRQAARARP